MSEWGRPQIGSGHSFGHPRIEIPAVPTRSSAIVTFPSPSVGTVADYGSKRGSVMEYWVGILVTVV